MTRAGWVTPAVMEELEIDLQDYAQGRVLQPIHAFKTGQIGQKPVKSEFPGEPVSYGIRRIEFDDYLLRRCGAELLLGQKLTAMRRDTDGWRVNDSIRAGLVVGAGGGLDYSGDSRIIDPQGELLATASRTETVLLADLSTEHVAETRDRFRFLPDRR